MAPKQPHEHHARDHPPRVAFNSATAYVLHFIRTKPLLGIALLALFAIYVSFMIACAASQEDYFLWAFGGWSLAIIAGVVSYTFRIWRDFFRHQKRADEELGLRKRVDERKKKPIIQPLEQDLDALKAEAKRALAGENQDTK
jgi:hypothetical protein